jgi:hypothetical protein
LQADISFPILGADFLRHFELLVDVAGKQLVQRSRQCASDGVFAVNLTPATHHPAAGGPDPPSGCGGSQSAALRGSAAGSTEAPSSVAAAATADWLRIVAEFPAVVQPFMVSSSLKHGVEHHIETTGRPVTAKFRRLDQIKLKAAKEEFARMLVAGVIRRSSSCWSSPLHMVRKKDGTWRPCGDFRRLNLITTEDRYPLPNMADLSSHLDGCTIFSKLDLQKGYLQVPVKQQDVPKTAIITPFGLFEFLRMPFGLRNAGMTFQRMMDQLFFDLPCVFVYLDALLIASKSVEDHKEHLRSVLGQLQQNGLVINAEKCSFGRQQLEFQGHLVSPGGISPLPDRVAAIKNFPRPNTVVELQAFLGVFNYYC